MNRNTADRYRLPSLRSALAAEYALGTLTSRVRRRFMRLMMLDPSLREEVRLWKLRLAALAFSPPDLQLPGSVDDAEGANRWHRRLVVPVPTSASAGDAGEPTGGSHACPDER